MSIERKTD